VVDRLENRGELGKGKKPGAMEHAALHDGAVDAENFFEYFVTRKKLGKRLA
jgi:hypothetical protein